MNGLFQYVPGNSPLHRMNPVTKILLTLSVCIAAFLTDNLFVLLFLLVFDLMIGVAAGAARKAFSIFKGLFKVSLFLFVLQVLFIRQGIHILGHLILGHLIIGLQQGFQFRIGDILRLPSV